MNTKEKILNYINRAPELTSLLYDMDLLPEQLDEDSLDWRRMVILTAWHMNKFEFGTK